MAISPKRKKAVKKDLGQRQILGILMISVSILILASLIGYRPIEEPSGISPDIRIENPLGIIGIYLGYFLVKVGFGYFSALIPLFGILFGWYIFAQKEVDRLYIPSIYMLVFIVLGSLTAGLLENAGWLRILGIYGTPGFTGGQISMMMLDFLGMTGFIILLIAGWLMWIRGAFLLDYYAPFRFMENMWKEKRAARALALNLRKEENAKRKHTEELISKLEINREDDSMAPGDHGETGQRDQKVPESSNDDKTKEMDQRTVLENIEDFPVVSAEDLREKTDIDNLDGDSGQDINVGEMIIEKEVELDKAKKQKKPRRQYQLPTTDLLMQPVDIGDSLTREELVDRATFLTESLATFGVEGKVVNVHPGPVITLFEVEPAEGVRVNKFVALSDDLARVMEASRVRVIAPIPGKSSVGIEIPNKNPATVYFKSIINSRQFVKSRSKLTLAVGKTTSGEIAVLDLEKMPHLLIAGTTGSGKSVCLNTIICSILYQVTPDEVKFMVIDPKKVEMSFYRALEGYHLLKTEDIDEPIVTSTENAILALRALEKEMDRRYNVLADSVVRNIGEYNEKARKNKEKIMPFIVLIVDELADLMMLSAKDVEAPIARLAQLARAVGIHLVIATQRPSVDVITGVIKANFPARIAFQVASKIDSRTILDSTGAEKLIGRGDMLVIQPGSSEPVRLHNAFLTLEEIQAIMEHIVDQEKSEDLIIESVRDVSRPDVFTDESDEDELLNEAIKLVITHQQGSISLLQRRLKVGYSRAARLIDAMEQIGVVGPFTGSKAREVLVDELYLQTLE